MSCWHFSLRRKLLPYIEGELREKDVRQLERHLLDCGWCRELLLHLRDGHHMAQRLPRQAMGNDHPSEFRAMMADAGEEARSPWRRVPAWHDWLERFATPPVLGLLAVVLVAQCALLVVSNRDVLFGQRSGAAATTGALDLHDFHRLDIANLKFNTEPRIATQGYVTDVHTDAEEGTVAFKLVESSNAAGPFVVCEIMSPIKMAAPRDGSYVRVYGVSRFDAQAGRKWYEVNPVLDIAVLKR
ncbi:MAG TPA: zf-HC2 domain-containing protein [Terriglobia bacterium]|nr:zf-HC2 domain-containing protein [Terriglobia bacterium]